MNGRVTPSSIESADCTFASEIDWEDRYRIRCYAQLLTDQDFRDNFVGVDEGRSPTQIEYEQSVIVDKSHLPT